MIKELLVMFKINKKGFTLAEVLIAIAVIGIAATMVIPPVAKNIQDFAFGSAKADLIAKIKEATKQMKSADVLSDYDSNNDFIDVFQKYVSVVKRCDSTNLDECFPAKFKTPEGEEIETSLLTQGTKLDKKNLADNTIALVLKNGTSILFSLKDPEKTENDCVRINPFDNTSNTLSCMSFLYDINGKSGPNIVGRDIGAESVTGLSGCIGYKLDGACYLLMTQTNALTEAQCIAQRNELGYTYCPPSWAGNDYWAGAHSHCGVGKMATEEQVLDLARDLYTGGWWGGALDVSDATLDVDKASALGAQADNLFAIWFSYEHNMYNAGVRAFGPTRSAFKFNTSRTSSSSTVSGIGTVPIYTVCIK